MLAKNPKIKNRIAAKKITSDPIAAMHNAQSATSRNRELIHAILVSAGIINKRGGIAGHYRVHK